MDRPPRLLVVSDFTADNLAAALRGRSPAWTVTTAPFGQTHQTLLDFSAPVWAGAPEYLVLWTRPEAAFPSFRGVTGGRTPPRPALEAEVDEFLAAVARAAERVRAVFVPLWVSTGATRGWGPIDAFHDHGVSATLDFLNDALRRLARRTKNIFPLDAERWLRAAGGDRAYSPRGWYLGKIPFVPDVFKRAADDVAEAVRTLEVGPRKWLIVDLDDTLWGGALGEVGRDKILLGGHDPAGEAFADVQRELAALKARGVLLAIASKNDEAVVRDAFDRHPDMVLRWTDFAAARINWDDKAKNIADLAAELRLGLNAAVFIDDHPAERDRVRNALPEVLVPDWPADPALAPQALRALAAFDAVAVSEEDRRRTALYAEEKARAAAAPGGSRDAWLKSLGATVWVNRLNDADLTRAAQLLNKTNQMNLATRRLTEGELRAWAAPAHRRFFTFRVADKFGDAGLVGLGSVEVEQGKARVTDFVLSCRVLGRGVERTVLSVLAAEAKALGAATVTATLVPTERNRPCAEFWERESGFEKSPDGAYVLDLARAYPAPDHLTVARASA